MTYAGGWARPRLAESASTNPIIRMVLVCRLLVRTAGRYVAHSLSRSRSIAGQWCSHARRPLNSASSESVSGPKAVRDLSSEAGLRRHGTADIEKLGTETWSMIDAWRRAGLEIAGRRNRPSTSRSRASPTPASGATGRRGIWVAVLPFSPAAPPAHGARRGPTEDIVTGLRASHLRGSREADLRYG